MSGRHQPLNGADSPEALADVLLIPTCRACSDRALPNELYCAGHATAHGIHRARSGRWDRGERMNYPYGPTVRADHVLDYIALFVYVYQDKPEAIKALTAVRNYVIALRDDPDYQCGASAPQPTLAEIEGRA